MKRFIAFDAAGRFVLGADDTPTLFDAHSAQPHAENTVHVGDDVWAVLVSEAQLEAMGERFGTCRSHASEYLVARGFGLLRNQRQLSFDPRDGSEVAWGEGGVVARGASGKPLFPRIDPSVIGVVQSTDGERILLGENARRPGYFTLIAGYIDVGETIEDAFAREVWEETGRRVGVVRYVGSQPWALSGALMLGMVASTSDVDAVGPLDGELTQLRWLRRDELGTVTLAVPGTIARRMIDQWARGEFNEERRGT
ncbi:NAD(+) diphosphatase [Corynebacterium pseudogenitalium]|uniref:NAD(+) diphosphatase n=1 Tax=Corynebacterium pseudogenitalium TaxID=38303 RepID=A0ABD4TQJ9_9CORY|nr:NUDIX domain-containing protein [Corynebacterium pseudogenitalium]MCQ4614590.1 NUDIX domain-containing protein [Corynebacterium pseudogenitalium]